MEGFVVRWQLSTPMAVPERPIHLDALLASAKVDEELRRGTPCEHALAAQDELPLERAGTADGEWVWKASQLLCSPTSPPINVQMTRRVEMDVLAADRDRIFTSRRQALRIGTGPFRNYDLRLAVQWQGSIEAYGIGDLEAVRVLLQTITSLGRMRRNGWGKIASFSVTGLAGQAMDQWKKRSLPRSLHSEALSEHQPGYGTYRPPYWNRAEWSEILEWPIV